MQTIEEYKTYTKQLEGEVGKWHNAYDALVIERNQLVSRIKELEARKAKGEKTTAELVKAYEQLIDEKNNSIATLKELTGTCSRELKELRKHEVEWDLSKARIKELESQLKQNQGEKQDENIIP